MDRRGDVAPDELSSFFALVVRVLLTSRVPRLKRFLNEIPIRPENSRVIHNPGGLFASRLFLPFRSRFIANSRYRIATHFHCRSISAAQWADYYTGEKILDKHERVDSPRCSGRLRVSCDYWVLIRWIIRERLIANESSLSKTMSGGSANNLRKFNSRLILASRRAKHGCREARDHAWSCLLKGESCINYPYFILRKFRAV